MTTHRCPEPGDSLTPCCAKTLFDLPASDQITDGNDADCYHTIDVIEQAEPWLELCGPCDFAIPTRCTCPQGDYRTVMLALVTEVQRLRNTLKAQQ